MDDIHTLKLPTHIQAEALHGIDVVSGEHLTRVVVWADRVHDTCPRCRQPIPTTEECPVLLNSGAVQGGLIEEVSQQHGCGEWLTVHWRDVASADGQEVTEDDILTAAAELARTRHEHVAEARTLVEADLRKDLAAALARLAEPLADGETAEGRADEVTTGSEVDPGVYPDGGEWLAWAYPPVQDGADAVTVYASDMTGGTRG